MKIIVPIFVALLSSNLFAGVCDTPSGVNLSANGGPYANIFPRNQGSIGTCFAHSATDLVSSYLKVGRLNVLDGAVASNNSADGGQPADVMNALFERGWGCADSGQFWNLFPSSNTNVVTELHTALMALPLYYTSTDISSPAGIARHKNIAALATDFADGSKKPCGVYLKFTDAEAKLETLEKDIDRIENYVHKLEKQERTAKINAALKAHRETLKVKKNSAEKVEKVYSANQAILDAGHYNLDKYSVEEAAEIVYYWTKEIQPQIWKILNKYGMGKFGPSAKQLINDKLTYDTKSKSWSGGAYNYAHTIVEWYMKNSCAYSKVPVASNLVAKTLSTKKEGSAAIREKIDSLLEKTTPQGVGISIEADLISPSSGTAQHAVNIIGCRTLKGGSKEYLIHNSWGSGCKSYHLAYQSPDKCQNGRIWVSADLTSSKSSEIEWIQKK
jgi:hypothetical protein